MIKKFKLAMFLLAATSFGTMQLAAQNVTIHGVFQSSWNDNGEAAGYYLAWNYALGKAISWTPQGVYQMQWDGTSLTKPVRVPNEGKAEDFFERTGDWTGNFTNNELASWVADLNLMAGNSGAVKADNVITTVFSRTGEDISDNEKFAVRKWDAETISLLSGRADYYPLSSCIESAGMAQNPVDGKVYGLFYLTHQDLPEDIVNDPDYFADSEDSLSTTDAGYCLCEIDLQTMKISPITKGLYYYNFVTFAINSEGRAFALTSGGVAGVLDEEGKVYDIDGNPSGATLCEFDLTTGLMLGNYVNEIDDETGETYQVFVNKYGGTGFPSQYRRQSACFDPKNPYKMYWNGYINSGKGYNENGVWSNLPDYNWKENGKHDTAIYEVDITTGEAKRLALIADRYSFSCLWAESEDENDYRDVNADGVWDIVDVNILINIMRGQDNAENYNGRAYVTEGDEIVDVADVNAAINKMLGRY